MRLREYVEIKPRVPKRRGLRHVALFMFNVIIQSILPFVCGFYFYQTRNLMYLVVFVVVIFFNIEVLKHGV
jgi:hypothetical protein